MTTDETQDLRRELEYRLRGTLSSSEVRNGVKIEREIDPLDRAVGESNRHAAVALGEVQRNLATAIESALERLAEGQYGVCLECDGKIAPKRLQAVPWAILCRECQEKTESRA